MRYKLFCLVFIVEETQQKIFSTKEIRLEKIVTLPFEDLRFFKKSFHFDKTYTHCYLSNLDKKKIGQDCKDFNLDSWFSHGLILE